MLQNTVPNIMHTNRDENPTWICPIVKLMLDNATVKITNAIVMFRRFVLELNSFSSWVKIQPISAPSAREQMISTSGLTMMDTKST